MSPGNLHTETPLSLFSSTGIASYLAGVRRGTREWEVCGSFALSPVDSSRVVIVRAPMDRSSPAQEGFISHQGANHDVILATST